MKIKIIASGEIRHIQNDMGSALVSAGLAEALSDRPQPGDYIPEQPKWEVTTVGTVKEELVVRMTILGQTYYFSGNPANANKTISWDGGCRFLNGMGRAIPKDILETYRDQWKSSPALRGPEFSMIPEATSCPENEKQAAEKSFRENKGR